MKKILPYTIIPIFLATPTTANAETVCVAACTNEPAPPITLIAPPYPQLEPAPGGGTDGKAVTTTIEPPAPPTEITATIAITATTTTTTTTTLAPQTLETLSTQTITNNKTTNRAKHQKKILKKRRAKTTVPHRKN